MCVATLALVSAGCRSIEPAVLEPRFSPPRLQSALRGGTESLCTVRITSLLDKRAEKHALGTVAVRPVRGPKNTRLWLNNILADLAFYGTRVQLASGGFALEDAAAALDVEVELLMTSVSTIATALVANVELEVRYSSASAHEQHRYRGTQTLRNFTSRNTEIQQLVDESFDDVLQQMNADVQKLCNKPGERTH